MDVIRLFHGRYEYKQKHIEETAKILSKIETISFQDIFLILLSNVIKVIPDSAVMIIKYLENYKQHIKSSISNHRSLSIETLLDIWITYFKLLFLHRYKKPFDNHNILSHVQQNENTVSYIFHYSSI